MKKIGLALGGGGARGLAHVVILELFDELGIKPHRISGTSMGAIMGAMYAAGIPGSAIRKGIDNLIITKDDSLKDIFQKKDLVKTLSFLDVDFTGGGLFKGEKFVEYLYGHMKITTFEDLQIPLTLVATDYWTREQVVLDSGELLPAIKASMGLPGIFKPVLVGDRVLIDGGGVNPVPYDLLMDECDITIAIDVAGRKEAGKRKIPYPFDAIMNMFQIMESTINAEKLQRIRPDIYIKPDITNVEILEFIKANDIYRQTAPARDELRQQLEKLLTE